MTSFGKFIKKEREKKGWSQTEFGAKIKINTPAVSRIENDKKIMSASKLELLSKLFDLEYSYVKDLYFAEKFAKEAYKFQCSENVFKVAENQAQYIKSTNLKQAKIKF
jgi:transcriptional regulator with XRE-family HTH domain